MKIGNNRYQTMENGERCTRLHSTIIVRQRGDSYTLNSGGWRTATTKKAINEQMPTRTRVLQHKHEWYVERWGDGFRQRVPFHDGIVVPDCFMEVIAP